MSTEQRTGTTWPQAESRVRLDESAPRAGVRVLAVAGEIDRTEAEEILERLVGLLGAPDAQLVVLDLAAVRFMGSHGLTTVVHAQRSAASLGRTLRGVTGAANRAVSRPITMTGLDRVIDWFPSLSSATATER
ncbi:STAS domain-containing protein [Pseudonocardia sp. KRD291]|uniref:STAS domain-containing protein n=1 Tax=Pseudonocardia sp. KRD291 TaxID=2792007 RepID=UPI001C4A34B7|nr:STAS domain-containing protein [Pseudonocardia sp. KRD291]MBW0101836.1 STAS domain-containing protein [Pseudonocardia sp. KRD291]